MRRAIAIIVGLAALAGPVLSQTREDKAKAKAAKELAKYEKGLVKTQEALDEGNYKSAKSQLTKARKKIVSKLGANNVLAPRMYMMDAQCDLGLGMPKDFELNVQNALRVSTTVNGESSEKHAGLLVNVADLYNQMGYYRISREHLDKAKQMIDAGTFEKEALRANFDIVLAEAMMGQGYWVEALKLARGREAYYAKRAVKQETVPDGKGGLKSQKIPDEQVAIRMSEYGRVLALIGNTYRQQGNFNSADSAFEKAATWLRRNINDRNIAYLTCRYLQANMFIENGLTESLPKENRYDRLLAVVKAYFYPSHMLSTRLYEATLTDLLRNEEDTKYANTKAEYESVIKKEFPEKSIYVVRLKAIEYDKKLDAQKTKGLEKDASALITNSAVLPRKNLLTAEVLEFLAQLSIVQKSYAGAEKYLQEIVDIKSEFYGEAAPEVHLSRVQLANFYLDNTNKMSEAGKIYEVSYDKVLKEEMGAWHKDHLDILNHVAIYYEMADQYSKATETLELAGLVSRAKYKDTDFKYGEELTRIAKLEIRLGRYKEAEEHINKSLTILEKFEDEHDKKGLMVEAIDTKAVLFGIKGMFDEAEDALNRSAKIIKKADGPLNIDELTTAQNLSSLLIQLGRYSDTDEILNVAIAEYTKTYGDQSLRLIDPLVNKGRLLLARGDYTEADKVAMRANQIAVKIYSEKSTKTAVTQKLLSDIDYTIGDYDLAEDNIVKALASQEKQFGRKHIEVAKSLSQLALIKFYKGDDKDEVEKVMLESRNIMGELLGKDNPQYADILKNVAVLYISEHRYDIAFNALTQAETIWRNKTGRKNSIQAAAIYALTGDVYYQQKNYNKAEEYYKKGKDLYDKFFSDTHPEYVKILSKIAKVYYMEKDFKGAKKNIEQALNNYESFIKQFFPALSEREKAKYWNTIKGDFEFYNTLAFSQLEDFRDLSGKVYNYQLLTKALLLSSSIKIRERILNSKDEVLKATYADWVQKKEFLTNVLSMSSQQLLDNGIDPNILSAEVEKLERELSEKSEIFGQGFENKRITYQNVQESLTKTEAAIEMVRFRYFNHTFTDSVLYVALYVKNDKARPKVVELTNGHLMEGRFFRYYRNSIIRKSVDENSYKVYWEPIQKAVGQASTIYLSPDGVYNQINLEAIPTPDGKYVIDNSNIVIVSNTKDLFLRKAKAKIAAGQSNNASMFGNPKFYLTASTQREWTDLPGTEKEVDALNKLLKERGWASEEYMEANASEDKIKSINSPRVFHIATHGFYTKHDPSTEQKELTSNEAMLAENPLMKSGLLLTGGGDVLAKTKHNYNIESGVLTAYEAMSLNLDKTDLVVLSACETGLGEISNGEGVYGLQRAFLVAGAKVLIMSMFKVDDEATQKLILNFYRKWLTTGNLRQSFIDSKRELRVEYPEPIYWGAFMMIGLD